MISNRVLWYMTGLVLVGIALLFILNITSILSGQAGPQIYLKYNDVRGIAIMHHDKLYTLNFDQQNKVVDMLNQSIPATNINQRLMKAPDIEKIIIYQFDNKPDLILTPMGYFNHQLVYSMPAWNTKEDLIEMSNGRLQQLLSHTYDH